MQEIKGLTGKRIKELCDEKGIGLYTLESSLGLANGSVARWIKGQSPKSDALEKVADYFHVSTDFLIGRTDERNMLEEWNKKYDAKKLATDVKEIETIAAHLDNPDLTEEDYKNIESYIKFVVANKQK